MVQNMLAKWKLKKEDCAWFIFRCVSSFFLAFSVLFTYFLSLNAWCLDLHSLCTKDLYDLQTTNQTLVLVPWVSFHGLFSSNIVDALCSDCLPPFQLIVGHEFWAVAPSSSCCDGQRPNSMESHETCTSSGCKTFF